MAIPSQEIIEDTKEFAEWLRRQGHQVLNTQNCFWYDIGPRIYQAIPYHHLVVPPRSELNYLFRKIGALGLRYSQPLSYPDGQISYHVVYEQDTYEIGNLPKKVRHDITRGMRYASYAPIPFSRLADEGWRLREDTLIRQGRPKAETKVYWESLCISAVGLPSFEAWGALHEGNLVAALFACTIGDTVSILYQQSMSQSLKHGVNNALTYIFTHEVLQRPRISCIFYGLHSLDAPPSVDEYKFRMRFSAKPIRQRVIFNPLISPVIQPLSHKFLKILLHIFPASYPLAKAEGMVRFYLQGKCSLTEHDWPAILQEQRDLIIAQSAQKLT